MTYALALVLAQSCASLLPARGQELEWVLNGRPYARDIPTGSTAQSRTYRREYASGERATRTLGCTSTGGASVLVETLDDVVQVRLPVQLAAGQTRTISGAAVRRIEPPADGARNALWFTITRNQVRMYGARAGAGIFELRMQSASGAVQVYRATVRSPERRAATGGPDADSWRAQVTALQQQQQLLQDSIRRLETVVRLAREETARADSLRVLAETDLASLHAERSPLDERLITTLAVQVYIERGEYAEAAALLAELRRQIAEFERLTGIRHPGYEGIDKLAANAGRRARNEPRAPRPYTLQEVVRLLQGGVPPERVAEQVQRRCRSFELAPDPVRVLRLVGASPAALERISAACFRAGGRP